MSEAEEGDGKGEVKPKKRLQACILCPQRLFKNDKMVEDHVKSKVSMLSLIRLIGDPTSTAV